MPNEPKDVIFLFSLIIFLHQFFMRVMRFTMQWIILVYFIDQVFNKKYL